jgi:hypothetical protein
LWRQFTRKRLARKWRSGALLLTRGLIPHLKNSFKNVSSCRLPDTGCELYLVPSDDRGNATTIQVPDLQESWRLVHHAVRAVLLEALQDGGSRQVVWGRERYLGAAQAGAF